MSFAAGCFVVGARAQSNHFQNSHHAASSFASAGAAAVVAAAFGAGAAAAPCGPMPPEFASGATPSAEKSTNVSSEHLSGEYGRSATPIESRPVYWSV